MIAERKLSARGLFHLSLLGHARVNLDILRLRMIVKTVPCLARVTIHVARTQFA